MLEKIIEALADKYNIKIESIQGKHQRFEVEDKAEKLETEKDEACVGKRLSIALYYIGQGCHEDAIYQIAKAAKRAPKIAPILKAKLRHIAATEFHHILEIKCAMGENVWTKYPQTLQEMCYNYLFAAEGYIRDKRESTNEIGVQCFNQFLQLSQGINLQGNNVKIALSEIRYGCKKLEVKVDEYCTKNNIRLNNIRL